MRQPLFERVQRCGNWLGVGERDVAPHAVGTCAQASGLAQRAAANGCDLRSARRIRAECLFQQRGQRRGEHLRKMAHPCAYLVVTSGSEVHGACAELCHPLSPLRLKCAWSSAEHGREEPHCVLKQCGFGQRRAARFLARHRMAGKKASLARLVVELCGQPHDLNLGAAHVGDQLMLSKHGREPLHPIEDREHRPGQQDDVAGCGYGIGGIARDP